MASARAPLIPSGRELLGHGELAPYRWVRPPSSVASENVRPRRRVADVEVGLGADVWTEDLQLIVTLARGTVDAEVVSVSLTPLDPGRLGPPPDGLVADGNAYRVSLSLPNGGPVDVPFSPPGRVLLRAPHEAQSILFSVDGRTWSSVPTRRAPDGGYEAPLEQPGHFLAVTDHSLTGGGGGLDTGVVFGIVTVVLVLAILAAVALRRS